MKIKINFFPKDYILIDLFDNPTVNKWSASFKDNTYRVEPQFFTRLPPRFFTAKKIQEQWDIIKINCKVVDPKLELPNEFNKDQALLNKIHRLFTSNLNDMPAGWTKEEWEGILSPINFAVHYLETYTKATPNKQYLDKNYPIIGLSFLVGDYNWLQFNSDDILLNYHKLDKDNLVYLDASIFGKSVLRSYYDNDDPSEIDCTGRLGSYGGFTFDVNRNRRKLYSSDHFKNWITEHGLDPDYLPLELPIGEIVESTKPLKYFFFFNKFFKTVEFLN